MGIRQLSVFVENKRGSLHEIADELAKANIDLRSMCIADTIEYGIVRIIVDDPIRAQKVLSDAGHTANIRVVTAFAVPDKPGGLANVLNLLEGRGINIEYLYALVNNAADKAYAVMRTEDPELADAALRECGVELLDEECI